MTIKGLTPGYFDPSAVIFGVDIMNTLCIFLAENASIIFTKTN